MNISNKYTLTAIMSFFVFLLLYVGLKEGVMEDTTSSYLGKIPKVIIITYHTKNKIPKKVYKNLQQYAPNYQLKIFDDDDIILFLKEYYAPPVLAAFKQLTGAHKADLFRYCYLYKFGGVYIDIKTELIKSIDDVLNQGEIDLYTVLSMYRGTIYQGVIATKPNNPLFKELIDFMVKTKKPVKHYFEFTFDFYRRLQYMVNKHDLTPGYNKTRTRQNVYLFQEKCTTNPGDCIDGLDRYKKCCYVYNGVSKVIKTRYADYPWV